MSSGLAAFRPPPSVSTQSMNTHRILERAGLRPTFPRVLVLEFFQAHAHEHLAAEAVYVRLNEDSRNMSLATVYRVLAQLVDAQLLSNVAFGDGRMVYELNDGNPHDHIICNACGGVHEFFDAEIEARQQAVAEQFEFAVSGRRLVLFGLCVNCKKLTAPVKRTIRK
ncbi:Fur family transcriptional regulator [Paraburkholderia sp. BL21I4N1]|uniref:Fur family transcriptional regulator n=1 Tax=Paraburkholderia sp. BL21I4N1 TaxID=1938801 RepID=UPI0011B1F3A5|nr:Fur family transcriptional regulator [Paraburkholderia sp. BL21I4N1]